MSSKRLDCKNTRVMEKGDDLMMISSNDPSVLSMMIWLWFTRSRERLKGKHTENNQKIMVQPNQNIRRDQPHETGETSTHLVSSTPSFLLEQWHKLLHDLVVDTCNSSCNGTNSHATYFANLEAHKSRTPNKIKGPDSPTSQLLPIM